MGTSLAPLNDLLLFGSLPDMCTTADEKDKETDLFSYVTTYLEEEVRAEALTRNLGAFARFLELAASESGKCINMSKLSTIFLNEYEEATRGYVVCLVPEPRQLSAQIMALPWQRLGQIQRGTDL